MQNKPRDIPYCGVSRTKIQEAEPTLNKTNLRHLYNFITERYNIHLKKDVLKQDPPWTKDDVLSQYRFTNVRREHDKETKWLIEHIVHGKGLSYEDKLLNIILFRIYNKHETAELLNMPIAFHLKPDWNPKSYRIRFIDAKLIDRHRVFFTGAFITGGTKRALKWYLPKEKQDDLMEMRVLWFIRHLLDINFIDRLLDAQRLNPYEVFKVLSSMLGIGEFLGYQMFVDMTYIPEFPFSENEFTVAGPGCVNGLKLIFNDTDKMSWEECIFWLRDNLDWVFPQVLGVPWDPNRLFRDLEPEDRCLNVMSLENCMCEISKYIRAKNGTGRPRKNYVWEVQQ